MPQDRTLDYTLAKVEPIYPIQGGLSELNFMPNISIVAGQVLGQVSSASADEVQTLTFSASWTTGDTFTVSIAGIDGNTYTTAALAYNISNANLKIALDALLATAGYAGATTTIGGGPLSGTPATITFAGTAASWDMPLMVATGTAAGNGTVAIATTTPGLKIGLFGAYAEAGPDDGRRVARAIAQYSFRTDNYGRVVFASSGTSPEYGVYQPTAPAWFKGRFRTTDLTGLDAAAIVDFARLESGALADGIISLT